VFALADLHLSLGGDKPMDVFGELWRDHPRRMAEAWDARVGGEDAVLLPGDLSWGRTLDLAAPDLAWIGERPGRKILLRGNHDGWWSSVSKVRRALPPRCEALQNDATRFGDWVVVGARGWTAPGDPGATPADEAVFRREIGRLERSIDDADRRFGRDLPRLAMTHYPPWLDGSEPTEVVSVLMRAGVRLCVYGHLHADDHRLAVRGDRAGIRFVFVAADAVDFAPVELPLAALAGTGERAEGARP
jgi:predicted phosphohydrolase